MLVKLSDVYQAGWLAKVKKFERAETTSCQRSSVASPTLSAVHKCTYMTCIKHVRLLTSGFVGQDGVRTCEQANRVLASSEGKIGGGYKVGKQQGTSLSPLLRSLRSLLTLSARRGQSSQPVDSYTVHYMK